MSSSGLFSSLNTFWSIVLTGGGSYAIYQATGAFTGAPSINLWSIISAALPSPAYIQGAMFAGIQWFLSFVPGVPQGFQLEFPQWMVDCMHAAGNLAALFIQMVCPMSLFVWVAAVVVISSAIAAVVRMVVLIKGHIWQSSH